MQRSFVGCRMTKIKGQMPDYAFTGFDGGLAKNKPPIREKRDNGAAQMRRAHC